MTLQHQAFEAIGKVKCWLTALHSDFLYTQLKYVLPKADQHLKLLKKITPTNQRKQNINPLTKQSPVVQWP